MKKINWDADWYFQWEQKMIKVSLPHDAMQVAGRAADGASGNSGAHYMGGRYVYQKTFTLTEEETRGTLCFQFDGIYQNAKIYINDQLAGSCAYGYLPFFVSADGLVHSGENRIVVEADNTEQPNSRWYSGGGLYRSVWLWKGGKAHIEPLGLRVTTVSVQPARIRVETEHSEGEIDIEILDGDQMIAYSHGDCVEMELPDAELWSDVHPKLYLCHAVLREHGAVVDEAMQEFGVRILSWNPTGFYVNGVRTMLRGGCLHHDNGILGACSIPEAEVRRLKILKNAGFNGIRCAHNPASTALLEACDRMGMYVIEEMWDMWYQRKNKYDYGQVFLEHWREDVRAVTKRDYMHPCVIMYSIGNEVTEPHEEKGITLGKKIAAYTKELDDTRPITIGLNMALVAMSAMGAGLYSNVDDKTEDPSAAVNSTVFNETVSKNHRLVMASCKEEVDRLCTPILDAMDIAGYNYGVPRYPLDAASHPDRVVVGTETFPHELSATWKELEKYPYVIGDFMWTAWDYIGECSIGTWAHTPDGLCFAKPYPWKLADAGAFDLIGTPTGEALWAEAVWKGTTSIGVRPVPYPTETLARGSWRGTNAIPSWSFQGCEGQEAMVEVYTPKERIALYLDGVLVAEQCTENMRAIFTLPYRPGTLTAVAIDAAGEERILASLTSADNPKWVVRGEEDLLKAGQAAFFAIQKEDEKGNVESNADEMLKISVEGGTLLGFGSAAPRTEAEFQTGIYPSHYGRALAAVRVEEPERFRISVCSACL